MPQRQLPRVPKFLTPSAWLPHSLRVEESHVPHQHASPVVANEHGLREALGGQRRGLSVGGFLGWGMGVESPKPNPQPETLSVLHFLGSPPPRKQQLLPTPAPLKPLLPHLSSTAPPHNDWPFKFSRKTEVTGHECPLLYLPSSQNWFHLLSSLLSFFSLFFFFLGLHLRHIEVPWLGVKLELQLPTYTTATATRDLSCLCDLQTQLMAMPDPKPTEQGQESSWILVRFLTS